MILHVPHSSNNIPLHDGYLVSGIRLDEEMLRLTDWYTNDLFDVDFATKVIAPFSRIFCDVERFSEDQNEIMSKFGMGMAYEKLDSGAGLRTVTPELKNKILNKYYKPHHAKLEMEVKSHLLEQDSCLIVDCHSFSDKPFQRDLIKGKRPDICIGTDEYHTPRDLITLTENFFKEHGYTCKINSPYSGSIVPIKYYNKDKRVRSIMIEINRKLYLKGPTNQKSSNYDHMKKVLKEYLLLLCTHS